MFICKGFREFRGLIVVDKHPGEMEGNGSKDGNGQGKSPLRCI